MGVGLKISDGDFILDNSGRVETISGTEKCSRDFKKMLETNIAEDGEIRYNPQYGNKLNSKNYFRNLTAASAIDTIKILLADSINYYISLQEQRINLSIEEIITNINTIVYQDPTNKQRILIDISIETGNGEELTVGQYEQEV